MSRHSFPNPEEDHPRTPAAAVGDDWMKELQLRRWRRSFSPIFVATYLSRCSEAAFHRHRMNWTSIDAIHMQSTASAQALCIMMHGHRSPAKGISSLDLAAFKSWHSGSVCSCCNGSRFSSRRRTGAMQVVRQTSIDARGISNFKDASTHDRYNSDIWKAITIGEGVFQSYCGKGSEGHIWMAWAGRIKIVESVKVTVAGFEVSELTVLKYHSAYSDIVQEPFAFHLSFQRP